MIARLVCALEPRNGGRKVVSHVNPLASVHARNISLDYLCPDDSVDRYNLIASHLNSNLLTLDLDHEFLDFQANVVEVGVLFQCLAKPLQGRRILAECNVNQSKP